MPQFNVTPVSTTPEKLTEICRYLCRTFRDAVGARTTQIDGKYQKWLDNYEAKPSQEIRSTPWVGASNFIPALTRMHTDILSARINGILAGTRPFWKPSTMNSDFRSSSMSALAKYMDTKCTYDLDFFPVTDEIILETCKTGTVVLKARWEENTKYVVDQSKQTPVVWKGLKLDVVPFYDFFPYPITAKSVKHTLVRHSRIRLTREEVEYRVNTGSWNADAAKLLLEGGKQNPNQSESNAATVAGISLTPDASRPYNAVEASFEYELEPGKMYNLICVFNPQVEDASGVLRLYHSYISDPTLDMYVDFRIIPRSNLFYGISIPEILDQAQEEQAQIHNDRRNASTIINTPSFKKKRYSLNNFSPASDYYPGKVWEVDNIQDVEPMQLNVTYNAMMEEENMTLQLAERYTGISAPMQGMGTGAAGKRGTYASQGTLALLAEGNRRLDIYIKRLRAPFHRLGKLIYISYRDFGDRDELKAWGTDGQLIEQAFDASGDDPRFRNIFFDFSASDAAANKEVDRSSLTIMANTAQAYYGQVVQLGQLAASMPDGSPAKNIVLAVLDGAYDLFERLLTTFDISDRKRLMPNVRALLSGGPPPAEANTPQPAGPEGSPSDVSISGLQNLLPGLAAAASSASAGSPGGPPNAGTRPQ